MLHGEWKIYAGKVHATKSRISTKTIAMHIHEGVRLYACVYVYTHIIYEHVHIHINTYKIYTKMLIWGVGEEWNTGDF